MLKRFLVGVAVAGGISLATGCVDPRGKFDDFSDRAGTTDASTIDGPTGSLADIDGTFLLGVRVGALGSDPSLYIQFLVTYDLTVTGETGLLDGSYVPLCVHSSCTERNMLPPALTDTQRAVAADGTFMQPVMGNMQGGANPVSGSPIEPLDGLLSGTIVSADLVCGTISGTAIVDLAGSTFAAIRVVDTTPANLPAPLVECPGAQPVDAGVDATL